MAGREEGMRVQQCTISDIKQERKLQFLQLCSHVKTVYLQVEAAFLVFKKEGEIDGNIKEFFFPFLSTELFFITMVKEEIHNRRENLIIVNQTSQFTPNVPQ